MSDAIKAYAQYISEQSKSHGKFHTGKAKPIREELPGAETLGKHAGHVTKHGIAKLGTKKKIRPDGSAELKLKLTGHKTTDSAHGEANKAADNLKKKGYTVHKVSVRKSQSAFGEPEHTGTIHLSHGG